MTYTSEHPIINVTVDARLLVVMREKDGLKPRLAVLLIRRGGEPYKGKLAMPGGFVNPDEELHVALRREVREETGLDLPFEAEDFTVYADTPDRDPRGRTISFVFTFHMGEVDALEAVAGDDAAAVEIVHLSDLKAEDCAFDHYKLIHT